MRPICSAKKKIRNTPDFMRIIMEKIMMSMVMGIRMFTMTITQSITKMNTTK